MDKLTYRIEEAKIHGNNWRKLHNYRIYVEGVIPFRLPYLKTAKAVNRVHGYYTVWSQMTAEDVMHEFIVVHSKQLEEELLK